ncbi:hypothetical protein BWR18_17485 [Tateyamaria omphalii]|uniref:Flagellar hook-length control protein-like C-terminal domain-containing protein n=1 Tax=Tateyamaria omphalii TaxID=299262 RepID=A0A1P8MZ03_9RHOB|nr:hypothetical protein BWR18_17485 [Tateyamaria omphalii]
MQVFKNGAISLPTSHQDTQAERADPLHADMPFSRHFRPIGPEAESFETDVQLLDAARPEPDATEKPLPKDAEAEEAVPPSHAVKDAETERRSGKGSDLNTIMDFNAANTTERPQSDAVETALLHNASDTGAKHKTEHKPSPISSVVQGMSMTPMGRVTDNGARAPGGNTFEHDLGTPMRVPHAALSTDAGPVSQTAKADVARSGDAAALPVQRDIFAGDGAIVSSEGKGAQTVTQQDVAAMPADRGLATSQKTLEPAGRLNVSATDRSRPKPSLAEHSNFERAPDTRDTNRLVRSNTTDTSLSSLLAAPDRASHPRFAQADLALNADDLVWDIRPSTAHTTAPTSLQLQKAELPPPVVQAIAEAVRKAPDKPIEIALNPAELGRVRMVMTTLETGITVTITADRGDTLDLMRRNIDDLGKSLSELGYEDVSFSFEGGQNPSDGTDEHTAEDAQSNNGPSENVPDPQHAAVAKVVSQPGATTGIDMRF